MSLNLINKLVCGWSKNTGASDQLDLFGWPRLRSQTVVEFTSEFLLGNFLILIAVVSKKLLVLRDQSVRYEHQPRMGRWILLPIIVKVIAMSLKVGFIEPAALDLDQEVTRESITE